MYNYKFTIFTPTYNRAYTLCNLYKDLLEQTFKDFEWLIVDDGSEDNTKDLIEEFIKEDKIKIKYIYKSNGGKHTAMNVGVKNASGEIFFTVDSDDRLIPFALEKIVTLWNSYDSYDKMKHKISGIAALCINENGKVIGTKMPKDNFICKFSDLYFKYHVKGDKAIMFTTEVMKDYPFPERKDVKFIPENVVLHEISKFHNIVCLNEGILIREYLSDGLTQNIMKKESLKGRVIEYLYLINNRTYSIKNYPYMWIKNYINFNRYSFLSDTNYIKEIDGLLNLLMCILMIPLGYIKYIETKRYINNIRKK